MLKHAIYNHITQLYHINFTVLSQKAVMVLYVHPRRGPRWFDACVFLFRAISLQTLLVAIWSCAPISSPFPVQYSVRCWCVLSLCRFCKKQPRYQAVIWTWSTWAPELRDINRSSKSPWHSHRYLSTWWRWDMEYDIMSCTFPQSHCDMILHISTECWHLTASVN